MFGFHCLQGALELDKEEARFNKGEIFRISNKRERARVTTSPRGSRVIDGENSELSTEPTNFV